MKLYYSAVDRQLLEAVETGPVLQRGLFGALKNAGSGEQYLFLRTRELIAKGQLIRTRQGPETWLSITPAGRHALQIMRIAQEAGL